MLLVLECARLALLTSPEIALLAFAAQKIGRRGREFAWFCAVAEQYGHQERLRPRPSRHADHPHARRLPPPLPRRAGARRHGASVLRAVPPRDRDAQPRAAGDHRRGRRRVPRAHPRRRRVARRRRRRVRAADDAVPHRQHDARADQGGARERDRQGGEALPGGRDDELGVGRHRLRQGGGAARGDGAVRRAILAHFCAPFWRHSGAILAQFWRVSDAAPRLSGTACRSASTAR